MLQAGKHVKSEYREVVLHPTAKLKNGRAVWSTENGIGIELHLYSDTEGKWCLSNKLMPEELGSAPEQAANEEEAPLPVTDTVAPKDEVLPEVPNAIAYYKGDSTAPPAEGVWELAKSMRDANDDCEGWTKGKLTLLCGEEGKARAVRDISQHSTPAYANVLHCASGVAQQVAAAHIG